ncbi:enoyl-CoA hydratase/isomerase family protein [Mesorhizobium sp. SB112]|uniref:enoyl-CoA hydratase/isomerase family protein n=1 Tax=Mesorhizobium sp. SB112 TaxID=3151853 RepID=UPI0032640B61
MDFGGGEEIRFERIGKAGVVTLTRPKALNALTHTMVKALSKALDAWQNDADVQAVVLRAEGRAFSAGGDILQVYHARNDAEPPAGFFADEYVLNASISRFEKPYVSLIDGIVMGGGFGISGHGSHRVMTENAQFAMPEVGIGFFPDVGGSFILPRLKGSFGIYLALTGNRIRYGDALWCGLATHAVASADLAALFDEICETGLPDRVLRNFAKNPEREADEAVTHAITRHFSLGTLDEILKSLKDAAASDEFAAATLATILKRSPTSLRVTFEQLRAGAMLEMDECMKMEFRILCRMLAGHEFYEGIRAAIVEKGATPQWKPAKIEDVSDREVHAYFEPLGERELIL